MIFIFLENWIAIEIFHNRESPIRILDCESPGPWSGQTPGTLGQVIRNLTIPARTGGIRNSTGGTAPTNNAN